MPRQLPPIQGLDGSNRKKLNQIIDDMTATADRATLSKTARIAQSQLHQTKVDKKRVYAGQLMSIRHTLGAIPSNVSISPIEGSGSVVVVRTTKDRVYIRASADMRVNMVIQR